MRWHLQFLVLYDLMVIVILLTTAISDAALWARLVAAAGVVLGVLLAIHWLSEIRRLRPTRVTVTIPPATKQFPEHLRIERDGTVTDITPRPEPNTNHVSYGALWLDALHPGTDSAIRPMIRFFPPFMSADQVREVCGSDADLVLTIAHRLSRLSSEVPEVEVWRSSACRWWELGHLEIACRLYGIDYPGDPT